MKKCTCKCEDCINGVGTGDKKYYHYCGSYDCGIFEPMGATFNEVGWYQVIRNIFIDIWFSVVSIFYRIINKHPKK